MTHFKCCLLWALLLFSLTLTAQDEGEVKYGRVSDADRQLTIAPGDSSAEAYVLYDKLDLDFEYYEGEGPGLVERRHRRVKLLTPASFDRADITFTYDKSYDPITGVEAAIHLPEGGSIKIAKSDFIHEKLGDGKEQLKFTFPRVTAGAIIEYRFNRRQKSILIPSTYVFQEDIPVRWAEFTAMVPAFYDYVSLGARGQYFVDEVKQVRRDWGPTFIAQAYGQSRTPHTSIRWAMKDIPAYEEQPYTNNMYDYLPKVRLQLQSVQYPGRPNQPVFSDWENTVDELESRSDFGRCYRQKGQYSKVWKEVETTVEAAATPKEKIEAAYYFVAKRMDWNGKFSIVGTDSPNRTFAEGIGNSADLNLMLLGLLREAGIEAYPLLVSLRDRGAPIEIYPILTQFDHLMVYTEVDGQPLLLDANDPSRPPGLPRVSALNHRGWVADKDSPRWINVEVPRARQIVIAEMKIDEEGLAEVDLQSRMESYYAFSGRSILDETENDDEGPLASQVIKRFPEAEVLDREVKIGDPAQKDDNLIYQLKMKVPAGVANGDYLYVQPVLMPLLNEELDDVEKRLYPIDFPFPWQERYIANVTIPEGYAIEEMPESIRLVSEDGGMTATFAISQPDPQLLSLNFSVRLDRTVYQPQDYTTLRQMYRRIIELQESTIILKRAK